MRPPRLLAALLLSPIVLAGPARADDRADCSAHGGQLLMGTVMSAPRYASGRERRGVELSHTHFRLRGEDGRTYDIAADNVFAAGYDASPGQIPSPLDRIGTGDRLQLCGAPYRTGSGMDWVHTNCNETPISTAPDGWLKVLAADGTPGPNLESSQEYCRLWGHSRRR